MNRFPFWIIPTMLFIFLIGIIGLLYFTGKLNFLNTPQIIYYKELKDERKREEKERVVKEQQKKPDYTYQIELPSHEEKIEIKNTDNNINIHINKEETPLNKYKIYREGILLFRNGEYQKAAFQFISFTASADSVKDKDKIFKARFYTAYSFLFQGTKDKSTDLIQKSQKYFLELYKTSSYQNELISQIILGLARSSRLLNAYPEGIDLLLKENLVTASQELKKHIYLELGYFYFFENYIDNSLSYFSKAEMQIANRRFFEILIEKEDTSLYLLTLFNKSMIPEDIYQDLKFAIQRKILSEARKYFKNEKKEEAFFLLKKLISLFPQEPIVEEAYFNLGDFYLEELAYQKSLFYFTQVLSNQFLDYDPAALFKRGIIYFRTNNYQESLKNFNLIRENFVSSSYYQPAQEWIKEIEKNFQNKKNQKDSLQIDKTQQSEKDSLLEEELFSNEKVPEEIY
ncbi:MAG TPA: hypothetical protein DHW82_10305 [Spirochaetia bacterium]|nr:MAG: hypothetical protein A2Y41_03870 [Spirochaetes bacterium GWB1_36_13]HCL57383.1 hypothetical protein [Spirochaetia bacterium]